VWQRSLSADLIFGSCIKTKNKAIAARDTCHISTSTKTPFGSSFA